MKILVIHPHIFCGGAEKAVIYLVYWLRKMGVEADILTLSVNLDNLPEIASTLNYLIPDKMTYSSSSASVSDIFEIIFKETYKIHACLEKIKDDYDLLNPHNLPSYWATFFKNKPPTVWMCNEIAGVYGTLKDVVEKNFLLKCSIAAGRYLDRCLVRHYIDEIVTLNQWHAQKVERTYGIRPKIVSTGVDVSFFSMGTQKKIIEKYALDNSFILSHVGALIPRKGQELSIRAVSILKSSIPNIRLLIVGTGPAEHRLKRLVKEKNLQSHVIFLGLVPDEELRDIYHCAHINLFPVCDQSWGMVPFEAMLGGAINIVSNDCGASIVIKENNLGYVVSELNEQKLSEVILHVYQNYQEIVKEIKERAKEYVKNNLTWEKYAEGMFNVFQNCLNKRNYTKV
ncbi:MAG: glycosyltransferase family 4 protein [Candidatus Bathyarchaeia archaeon]